MRICKYCNVATNDNELQCPLCGAHTTAIDASNVMVSGEYPSFVKKQSARIIVGKIFGGISVILLMAMLIASGLSHNWALFFVTGFVLAYIWAGILQYIFNPRPATHVICGVFFYIILSLNLIFAHYYAIGYNGLNGSVNTLNISIGFISPILLSILNVVLIMMMFISRKWYKFSYRLFMLSVIEIIWIIVVRIVKFNIIASIVCASIGVVALVVLWVFKKEDLLVELRKHFYL